MRIGGPIPFHAAQAYGVARATPARPPAAPQAATPTRFVAPAHDVIPRPQVEVQPNVQALLAGRVHGGVDFTSGIDPAAARGQLTLYTRAADKVEAAVAVQVGRSLDVRG